MRLSTLFQYQNNLNSFSRGVSAGNEIYNRLASNKSVLTPSAVSTAPASRRARRWSWRTTRWVPSATC